MKRNISIFIVLVLMLVSVGALEGCATQQIKSDDPFVMAKAAYYDANVWYNNTLETYLRYRPGIKPDRVKELNGLFLECDEILDTWKLAIQLKDLSKSDPEKFREVKNRIIDKTMGLFEDKEAKS